MFAAGFPARRWVAQAGIPAALCVGASVGAADDLPIAAPPAATRPAADVAPAPTERTIGVAWSGTRVRDAAERLAENLAAVVLLDRRLDPDRTIDLSAENRPASAVWQDLATRAGGAASRVGAVVYLGPASTAERLQTVAALRRRDVAKLPAAWAAALRASRPFAWDDRTEPRAIVARLAAECGLRAEGLEQMPHDLWYRARWPELPLVDRLTLVLAQFDATFVVDPIAGVLRFEAFPERPTIEERHAVGAADARRLAGVWRSLVPTASIRDEGTEVVVVGRAEDHERLAASRRRAVAPPPAAAVTANRAEAKVVFSLRAANVPLSKLIAALEAKQVTIRVDAAALERAGLSLERLTSVDVKNAAPVDLLEAACKPLGLKARQAGEGVEIVPRD